MGGGGDDSCEATAQDCEIPVPDVAGATANAVLKQVTPGCCGTITSGSQDLIKLAQEIFQNHSKIDPSKLPTKDIEAFCSKCNKEANSLMLLAISALQKYVPNFCKPTNTTESAMDDLTV